MFLSHNLVYLRVENQEYEQARLAALAAYDILDSKREEEFDAITSLAAFIANTPMALITLIDEQRQWFKSKVGLVGEQTPRKQAFCHYTIQGSHTLEVPDALLDSRFAQNPSVTGDPHIRYYCGLPLVNPEGFRLGSLCVVDRIPRQLSAEQQQALATLAREVMARLELKRQNRLIENQKKQLRKLNEHLEERVKQRTKELEVANIELAQTKYELDTFLYRASHDLKGPLCSLEGLIRLAQYELTSDPYSKSQPHYLNMMEISTHKLTRVLTNQLNYSQNFQIPLGNEQVDFQVLVTEVLTTCQSLQGYSTICFETSMDGQVPFYSDKERIRTILKNVIENSIIFRNPAADKANVNIQAACTHEKASIRVQDNGIGISPKALPSVFNMFTKCSSQSIGSGLGLFVAKAIAETLCGTIKLNSQSGEGTTVIIEIPNRYTTEKA